MDSKKIELLAPAGSFECAKAAFAAGADAVYLGLKSFSARDGAENFGMQELGDTLRLARFYSGKVHVALNTVVKEDELEEFFDAAEKVLSMGADALIIQDACLGYLIKKSCPEANLHLSTQAGVSNAEGARVAKNFGFSRVIAARETSLKDLGEISSVLECEAFVQGALCTCFSGQCYMSSFAGGNSGNRGRCKQPCRKKYSWNREGYDTPAYRLSLSDLCVGEDVEKYISVGVTSLKIEGRLRRPEYVSAAVTYYRHILDGNPQKEDLGHLKRAFNRGGYTRGLSFGQDEKLISSDVQGHIGEKIGSIEIISGKPVCVTKEKFGNLDAFKVIRCGREVGGGVFGGETREGFVLRSSSDLKRGDDVFITRDSSLFSMFPTSRLLPVRVKIRLYPGDKAYVSVNGLEIYGDGVLAEAKTRPLTEGDVGRAFVAAGKYPYLIYPEIEIGNVFMPLSALNELRRRAYAAYWEKTTGREKKQVKINLEYGKKSGRCDKVAVIAENLTGLNADIGILKPRDYNDIDLSSMENFGGEKFLFLPAYLSGDEIKAIAPVISSFDGVYADGLYGLELAKSFQKKLFAGTGFNVTNSVQVSLLDADYVALSKELSFSEAEKISAKNTFSLTAGGVKVMDLIYCPFRKSCSSCDKKTWYSLTDEEGRKFPVRRYLASSCRFEVYNCADLVTAAPFTGKLCDCTAGEAEKTVAALGDAEKLKSIYKNHTGGHSKRPIT